MNQSIPPLSDTAKRTPEGGLLGINTKCSTPPPAQNDLNARKNRYLALSTVRHLCATVAIEQGKQPLDFHRVSKCHYARVKPNVEIKQKLASKKGNRAYYTGIVACGSVWVCPVCSVKIQEKRRQECATIFDKARSEGLQVQLVTLTFPHYSGDSLSDLLKRQQAALKFFKSGKQYTKFKDRFQVFGFIQNRELTHSPRNGWHPHNHIGYITKDFTEVESDEFTQFLKNKWSLALGRAGFVFNHGGESRACDVLPNANLNDYLAKTDGHFNKWGVSAELSQSHKKKGRGSRTPFQIIEHFQLTHTRTDAQLFIEYLGATKGKAQMFFSRGLKDWAGLNDESDQEIADGSESDPQVMYLNAMDWIIVRDRKAQSLLLDIVEREGKYAAEEWLLDAGGYYHIPVYESGTGVTYELNNSRECPF